jgi:hypothetical protein
MSKTETQVAESLDRPIVWLVIDETTGRPISVHYSPEDAAATGIKDARACVGLSMDDILKLPAPPPEEDREDPGEMMEDGIRRILLFVLTMKASVEAIGRGDKPGPSDRIMTQVDEQMKTAHLDVIESPWLDLFNTEHTRFTRIVLARRQLLNLAKYINDNIEPLTVPA